ncbi:signal peptidase I [Arenibaculum pallidiluteum]|uniref:signal peptidase I n=1 Tax=Arenibaculum pallidiluteum TaxID=2812559 RepID=UPI001A95B6C5|nr:signal peptidase I [Arenibaculum pallidiluteum]
MTDLSRKQSTAAKKKGESFGETVRTLFWAILIALGVRTFAFEPFNIPSGSMIPTLLVGDYLFVSKFSYGYSRYTVAFGLPIFDGRILGSEPERGDIAVFKLPLDGKTDYIKRIIGLPGDRIQVTGGILHINGQPVKRERVEDFVYTDKGRTIRTAQFVETLPNGRTHRIIEESDFGFADNTREFTVPPGHYFAMGDNRDNSTDSRFPDVGFVPAENLVGRAEVIFLSLDNETPFWQLWRVPFETRYSRLFDAVR